MTPTRRLAAAIVGLVVGALTLAGCLYSAIPDVAPRPTTTVSPDTDGVDDDLLPYYGQTLDWSDCGPSFDCATVTAPLDWADTSKGDIDLAIVRHRATDGSSLGALLYNPGGPGGSGYTPVHDYLDLVFGEPLIDAYDIVGFDPRGVGRSTPVECLDDADMDAYLFDDTTEPRGSEAWRAEWDARNARFADACDANSGGLLPYLTTEYAARDVDLIRAVLGEKKLNWFGASYGTLLGATYAGLFPERVGRMVLDGAIDPSLPTWEGGARQAGGFESALTAFMAACVAGDDCPFRGTTDQALADLSTLLATLDTSPEPAEDGRALNGQSFFTAISAALYSEELWPTLTQAISDVAQGDPELAFLLADSYYDRNGGVYDSGNLSYDAFLAYTCRDWSTPDQGEDDAKAEAEVVETAPIIAPYWNVPNVCDVWPYPGVGDAAPITADGAPPILVIGTTNDPATPYAEAVALADQLSSGVLVTREGEGHTGYQQGSACVDDAIESYLLDGTVPEDGLTCS